MEGLQYYPTTGFNTEVFIENPWQNLHNKKNPAMLGLGKAHPVQCVHPILRGFCYWSNSVLDDNLIHKRTQFSAECRLYV